MPKKPLPSFKDELSTLDLLGLNRDGTSKKTGAEKAPVTNKHRLQQKPNRLHIKSSLSPKKNDLPSKTANGYFPLPNIIVDEFLPTLSPSAGVIYLHLVRLSHGFHSDTCTIGFQKLAERCGIKTKRVVMNAVRELASIGLIKVLMKGKSRKDGNKYKVIMPGKPVLNKHRFTPETGAQKAPPPVTNKHRFTPETGAQKAPYKVHNIKTHTKSDVCVCEKYFKTVDVSTLLEKYPAKNVQEAIDVINQTYSNPPRNPIGLLKDMLTNGVIRPKEFISREDKTKKLQENEALVSKALDYKKISIQEYLRLPSEIRKRLYPVLEGRNVKYYIMKDGMVN